MGRARNSYSAAAGMDLARAYARPGMTASCSFTQQLLELYTAAVGDFDYSPTAFYLLVTKLTEGRLPETDQRRSMVRPCGRDL